MATLLADPAEPRVAPEKLKPPGKVFAWRISVLGCLLLAALLVRVPGLGRPLVGHFSSKNTLYGMIARNWARGLTPAWDPRVDCLRGGERGLHLIEFPVAAYVAGAGWHYLGGSLDVWGRAVGVLFSVASVAMMYVLVQRWHGPVAAAGAGWTLALSPVSFIYGQSFMLESSIVCFALATFLALDYWRENRRGVWLAVGGVSLALLLLTKIYMLVLLMPLAVLLARRPRPTSWLAPLLAGVFAIVPAAAWYGYAWWASQPGSANAAHVFFSLHDSTRVHGLPHPLLTTPDFYRQLLDDLTGPALTPLAFALALAGLLHPAWRRHGAWLATSLILVLLLPLKFYKMNYYDLVILPPLCVLAGLGWQRLYETLRPGRLALGGVLAIGLVLSLRYAARPAFVTPEEDRAVLAAAAAVRELVPSGAPVVAIHGSNFDLLYYCDRTGWAWPVYDEGLGARVEQAKRDGARWLVIADLSSIERYKTAQDTLAGLTLIREGDDFRVYRLR